MQSQVECIPPGYLREQGVPEIPLASTVLPNLFCWVASLLRA